MISFWLVEIWKDDGGDFSLQGWWEQDGHGQREVRAVHSRAGWGPWKIVPRVPQTQLPPKTTTYQGMPNPLQHRAQADQSLVSEPKVYNKCYITSALSITRTSSESLEVLGKPGKFSSFLVFFPHLLNKMRKWGKSGSRSPFAQYWACWAIISPMNCNLKHFFLTFHLFSIWDEWKLRNLRIILEKLNISK